MSEAALTRMPANEQLATVDHGGSPLDLPPAEFSAGLARRGANRKSLMDWIRSALVSGVDFGPIHTMSKDKCSAGKYCKNPRHFSKPVLFKPGSEKICGMLGVTPSFPTLKDYEDAALRGVQIKTIVLRCEMQSASGQLVAFGVGARNVEKDYGDLNKSLKMASKSAMIDATLRMGGLSELFTQDLDDMHPPDDGKEPPIQSGAQQPAAGQQPATTTQPQAQTVVQPGKPAGAPKATEKTRAWLVQALAPMMVPAVAYFQALKKLQPNQTLDQLPLEFCPTTRAELADLTAKIEAFAKGAAPAPTATATAPAAAATPPAEAVRAAEPWRDFKMPFGAKAGTPLEKLEKKYLFGLWLNYKPATEYNGNPLRDDQIQANQLFRKMLDEAGAHYQFTPPSTGQ
jgi:hypothetical protein